MIQFQIEKMKEKNVKKERIRSIKNTLLTMKMKMKSSSGKLTVIVCFLNQFLILFFISNRKDTYFVFNLNLRFLKLLEST